MNINEVLSFLKRYRTLTVFGGTGNYLKLIHYTNNIINVVWDFGDIDEVFKYNNAIEEIKNGLEAYLLDKQKKGYQINA